MTNLAATVSFFLVTNVVSTIHPGLPRKTVVTTVTEYRVIEYVRAGSTVRETNAGTHLSETIERFRGEPVWRKIDMAPPPLPPIPQPNP